MGNAKSDLMCPHCDKKIELEFDDVTKEVKKIKGASWKSILTEVDEVHWTDSHESGFLMKCDCGKHSVVYDLFKPPTLKMGKMTYLTRTESDLSENQMIGIFCSKCREAFLGKDFTCPTCGTGF